MLAKEYVPLTIKSAVNAAYTASEYVVPAAKFTASVACKGADITVNVANRAIGVAYDIVESRRCANAIKALGNVKDYQKGTNQDLRMFGWDTLEDGFNYPRTKVIDVARAFSCCRTLEVCY